MLDCDTEVLTKTGWIKIKDYKDQEILTFDPRTNEGWFEKPYSYYVAETEEFYHFLNLKGMNQVLSNEHRLLVYKGYKSNPKGYEIINPIDLSNGSRSIDGNFYSFKTCFNIKSPGLSISDELIRVDVMVQADGCICQSYPTYNYVDLHFRRDRKIQRCKELLTSAGFSFKEKLRKDGSTNIYVKIPIFINKDLTKYYEANFDQLKIVSEECLKWDGHEGYRSFYSSTNKPNADVIQFSMLATGIRASIHSREDGVHLGHSKTHNVIPTKNTNVGYNKAAELIKSVDGYKYSFVTSTGFFLARRNDYTFITGN